MTPMVIWAAWVERCHIQNMPAVNAKKTNVQGKARTCRKWSGSGFIAIIGTYVPTKFKRQVDDAT